LREKGEIGGMIFLKAIRDEFPPTLILPLEGGD
jgi:hypothetical protein